MAYQLVLYLSLRENAENVEYVLPKHTDALTFFLSAFRLACVGVGQKNCRGMEKRRLSQLLRNAEGIRTKW